MKSEPFDFGYADQLVALWDSMLAESRRNGEPAPGLVSRLEEAFTAFRSAVSALREVQSILDRVAAFKDELIADGDAVRSGFGRELWAVLDGRERPQPTALRQLYRRIESLGRQLAVHEAGEELIFLRTVRDNQALAINTHCREKDQLRTRAEKAEAEAAALRSALPAEDYVPRTKPKEPVPNIKGRLD